MQKYLPVFKWFSSSPARFRFLKYFAKVAAASPVGFPPSPGFPEESPAKELWHSGGIWWYCRLITYSIIQLCSAFVMFTWAILSIALASNLFNMTWYSTVFGFPIVVRRAQYQGSRQLLAECNGQAIRCPVLRRIHPVLFESFGWCRVWSRLKRSKNMPTWVAKLFLRFAAGGKGSCSCVSIIAWVSRRDCSQGALIG